MRFRFVAFWALIALVATACGARLSEDERVAAIQHEVGSGGGGGSGGDSQQSGSTPGAGGGTTGAADAGASSGSAVGSGGSAVAVPDAGGTSPDAATAAPSGGSQTGSGGDQSPGGNQNQATEEDTCTPGGDSDVGISGSEIRVATIADVTGPSPGLFKSAHQAVQAYANFVNSNGGVCGRGLAVDALDAKTDSGGNRAAVLDACNKDFALVGSMSAFDDGGAQAIDDCGIPDITSIPTSPERISAEWAYPVFPNRQDMLGVGGPTFIAQKFPDAVKKAGILWLNAAVTRSNAEARKNAWRSVGFDFIYEQEVQVLEANYTPFVLDMMDAGVEYVTMVADQNSIDRLLDAAGQQGFEPVWDWDSVAYDPGFITLTEGTAEGSWVFINASMFEESGGNPEMASYLEWLERSFPGAEPDYFGQYAWSAAALFVEKVRELGPEPTRAALRDALKKVKSWDGNGMHGPHNVGDKIPTTCFMYMQIKNDQFVRQHPNGANTHDCDLAGHWTA